MEDENTYTVYTQIGSMCWPHGDQKAEELLGYIYPDTPSLQARIQFLDALQNEPQALFAKISRILDLDHNPDHLDDLAVLMVNISDHVFLPSWTEKLYSLGFSGPDALMIQQAQENLVLSDSWLPALEAITNPEAAAALRAMMHNAAMSRKSRELEEIPEEDQKKIRAWFGRTKVQQ